MDIIVAEDLVEHLAISLIQFCEEAWRVLAPGGELFVRTPHHSGDSSWIDPTHRWHLNFGKPVWTRGRGFGTGSGLDHVGPWQEKLSPGACSL